MLEYHSAYYPMEDGWYLAKVLDLPGVVTQGKTLAGAKRMLQDALREMAEWVLQEGDPLPSPKPKISDKKALAHEPIRLLIRVQSGAAK